jgi:hypothetical protein
MFKTESNIFLSDPTQNVESYGHAVLPRNEERSTSVDIRRPSLQLARGCVGKERRNWVNIIRINLGIRLKQREGTRE